MTPSPSSTVGHDLFAQVIAGARVSMLVGFATVLIAGVLGSLLGDILPSSVGPLLVLAAGQFGLVIVAEASLSYLGLGTPPTVPSWGVTVASPRRPPTPRTNWNGCACCWRRRGPA